MPLTVGGDLPDIVGDMIGDLPDEPIMAPEPEEAPKPSRGRRRKDGTPAQSKSDPNYVPPESDKGPKDVPIIVGGSTLPRRGRKAATAAPVNVTPDQIADVLKGAHEAAAAMFGPEAAISDEQAAKIGKAMVPVMEDFGVVLAGKIVHVIVLLFVVASVEAPVFARVMNGMTERAKMAQQMRGGMTMAAKSQQPKETPKSDLASQIAQATGVTVGSPAGLTSA